MMGFSLLEVILSLLLIASTSVVLLQQQWQLNRLLNQLLISSQALVQFDNNHEKQ